jgi:hypothetical protein
MNKPRAPGADAPRAPTPAVGAISVCWGGDVAVRRHWGSYFVRM